MADTPISTTRTEYVVVRDASGAQVVPAEISLWMKDPAGLVSEPVVVPIEAGEVAAAAAAIGEELDSATGVYKAEITPELAGTWYIHWQAVAPTRALDSWFQVPWPVLEVPGS